MARGVVMAEDVEDGYWGVNVRTTRWAPKT
jgi:hypothetical protein